MICVAIIKSPNTCGSAVLLGLLAVLFFRFVFAMHSLQAFFGDVLRLCLNAVKRVHVINER